MLLTGCILVLFALLDRFTRSLFGVFVWFHFGLFAFFFRLITQVYEHREVIAVHPSYPLHVYQFKMRTMKNVVERPAEHGDIRMKSVIESSSSPGIKEPAYFLEEFRGF